MARYKKQKVHMIDMSGKMSLNIVHEEYTQKDEEQWEREIDEIQKKLDERMVRYDNHIKSIIVAAHSDTYQPSEEDSKYFIKTYGDKFLGRNPNNIRNRLKLYSKYLKEQD